MQQWFRTLDGGRTDVVRQYGSSTGRVEEAAQSKSGKKLFHKTRRQNKKFRTARRLGATVSGIRIVHTLHPTTAPVRVEGDSRSARAKSRPKGRRRGRCETAHRGGGEGSGFTTFRTRRSRAARRERERALSSRFHTISAVDKDCARDYDETTTRW